MSDAARTQTTLTSRIPVELTDVVIDFLHDDEESLGNCALVCKDWLPAARYHVFRELHLHPWNVEVFTNMITHPLATIKPHIHHLVIDQVKFRYADLFISMYHRLGPFDFLHRLDLCNIRWHSYEALSADKLASVFSSITDLRLYDLTFNIATDLWIAITRFPSLERLTIINPAFLCKLRQIGSVLQDPDAFEHRRLPNIRDLVIGERPGHQTHILNWFSSRGVILSSLSVSAVNLDFSLFNQYLHTLGASLLFLQVDVRDLAGISLLQLNLRFSTHLQRLRFRSFSFASRGNLLIALPVMLANSTSPYINRVEFAYILPEEPSFLLELENDARSISPDSSMWSLLDTALSGFTDLRTVLFRFSPDQRDPQLFAGIVTTGLRSCNARGLLSFEHPSALDRRDMFPPYAQPALWNGMVRGPLCIAQMQDSNV